MKKILAITAAAVAVMTATCAHAAPTIHKDVLGTWCGPPYTNEALKESIYGEPPTEKCPEPEDFLTIGPSSYRGFEFVCRVTAVKRYFDRNVIRSTKEMGDTVSQVTSSCEGMECEWREQVSLYLQKGSLVVKGRWRTREKCGR
jgi:hypothetical protein